MATNLDLNMELLEEAFAISGCKSKKETVNFALKEFIQRRKQKEILKFIGKVDLLLVSIASRRNFSLLSYDRDFEYISKYVNLQLVNFDSYVKGGGSVPYFRTIENE